MNNTNIQQANGGGEFTHPILQAATSSQLAGAQFGSRHVGYGLPCANCGAYYMADQRVCPICKSGERISAITTAGGPQNSRPLPLRDDGKKGRERLPESVNSQFFPAEANFCTLEHKHRGHREPAVICHGCYEQLQDRADLMEAALQIDLREATKIVYDAVWSDPSDASKTYHNAAQALLAELRKRSSITERPRVRVAAATSQGCEIPEKHIRVRCKALLR